MATRASTRLRAVPFERGEAASGRSEHHASAHRPERSRSTCRQGPRQQLPLHRPPGGAQAEARQISARCDPSAGGKPGARRALVPDRHVAPVAYHPRHGCLFHTGGNAEAPQLLLLQASVSADVQRTLASDAICERPLSFAPDARSGRQALADPPAAQSVEPTRKEKRSASAVLTRLRSLRAGSPPPHSELRPLHSQSRGARTR
jgi:hypothetical protein